MTSKARCQHSLVGSGLARSVKKNDALSYRMSAMLLAALFIVAVHRDGFFDIQFQPISQCDK